MVHEDKQKRKKEKVPCGMEFAPRVFTFRGDLDPSLTLSPFAFSPPHLIFVYSYLYYLPGLPTGGWREGLAGFRPRRNDTLPRVFGLGRISWTLFLWGRICPFFFFLFSFSFLPPTSLRPRHSFAGRDNEMFVLVSFCIRSTDCWTGHTQACYIL